MAETTPQFNDILLYTAPSGAVKIEVIFEGETFWLSQRKMGELFGKDVRTINEHLQNIFAEGELPPEATIRKIRIVQTEGNRDSPSNPHAHAGLDRKIRCFFALQ